MLPEIATGSKWLGYRLDGVKRSADVIWLGDGEQDIAGIIQYYFT